MGIRRDQIILVSADECDGIIVAGPPEHGQPQDGIGPVANAAISRISLGACPDLAPLDVAFARLTRIAVFFTPEMVCWVSSVFFAVTNIFRTGIP